MPLSFATHVLYPGNCHLDRVIVSVCGTVNCTTTRGVNGARCGERFALVFGQVHRQNASRAGPSGDSGGQSLLNLSASGWIAVNTLSEISAACSAERVLHTSAFNITETRV